MTHLKMGKRIFEELSKAKYGNKYMNHFSNLFGPGTYEITKSKIKNSGILFNDKQVSFNRLNGNNGHETLFSISEKGALNFSASKAKDLQPLFEDMFKHGSKLKITINSKTNANAIIKKYTALRKAAIAVGRNPSAVIEISDRKNLLSLNKNVKKIRRSIDRINTQSEVTPESIYTQKIKESITANTNKQPFNPFSSPDIQSLAKKSASESSSELDS
ncbi:hypothetical protein [Piscirickettsia litoralis]|uniref:Uncharacterized protein n=1 Tax=Piscirickettsia litoralis TaxID=1891921 RepID=A0ABX3A4T8_9GAMM|nr:hypothetical protein [Piscirickettsia litoralis]ODN43879.1 hypothetical protein BGC07_14510 [Piscirickettsia litoralis]